MYHGNKLHPVSGKCLFFVPDRHSWYSRCFAAQEKSITKTSFTMSKVVKPVMAIKIQALFCISTKLVPWEFLDALLNSCGKKNHIRWQTDLVGIWGYTPSYFSHWNYKPHSPQYTLPSKSAWNRGTEWRITHAWCLSQCGLTSSAEGALNIYTNTRDHAASCFLWKL